MKKILIVVGTRPNFIKITQFKKLSQQFPLLDIKIAHTGQHFDVNMAEIFFTQLNIQPDFFLSCEGMTPTQQIGNIMIALEKLIQTTYKPDLIITPGDVNSTLAVSLVANKLNIKLAHLESGLRSNDREMPEEINRILTDEISDYYFITEKSGEENLIKENKKGERFFVGNTMIDTLVAFEKEIEASNIHEKLKIKGKYILTTLHRPSNVDDKKGLEKMIDLFKVLSKHYQIVFPIHPRTIQNLKKENLYEKMVSNSQLIFCEPLGYFDFQKLVKNSNLILTDSGGIQEESTFRQIPCLTLRENTERPITCELGTNTLVPFDIELIMNYIQQIENNTYKKGQIPPLWDGKATQRIFEIFEEILNVRV